VTVTREFLDFAPVLRAIGRLHLGTDNVDLEACLDRRVRVIQPINASVRSHAEYLLASLLLLFRRGMVAALQGDRTRRGRSGANCMAPRWGSSGWHPRRMPWP
jgi:D-3-phosphoglycerate dehydrogenase